MTKAQTEKQEAIDQLREWLKPGDTVYTILESVSRSGMSRTIRVVVLKHEDGKVIDLHPNWSVAKAIGARLSKGNDGIVMGGCGMDMGFALVYSLSRALFRDTGFTCTGEDCPSNDHSNAYHDKRPTKRTDPFWKGFQHSDPGYALKQRWL